jgi:hypothetical protein
LSGFSTLTDSIAFSNTQMTITSVSGAYTLNAMVQDQCGNLVTPSAFRIWVKTKPPVATLGIIPHQFVNSPVFEVAPNSMSELIPARTVVSEADAMAMWQSSMIESNRMVKLAPTPEGMPTTSQGTGALSGWRLNQPIRPGGIPLNVNVPSSSSSNWVDDSTTVYIQDSCGNISNPTPINGKRSDPAEGRLTPTPRNIGVVERELRLTA